MTGGSDDSRHVLAGVDRSLSGRGVRVRRTQSRCRRLSERKLAIHVERVAKEHETSAYRSSQSEGSPRRSSSADRAHRRARSAMKKSTRVSMSARLRPVSSSTRARRRRSVFTWTCSVVRGLLVGAARLQEQLERPDQLGVPAPVVLHERAQERVAELRHDTLVLEREQRGMRAHLGVHGDAQPAPLGEVAGLLGLDQARRSSRMPPARPRPRRPHGSPSDRGPPGRGLRSSPAARPPSNATTAGP